MSKTKKGGNLILLFIIVIAIIGGAFLSFRQKQQSDKQSLVLGAAVTYVEGVIEYKSAGGEWTRINGGETLSEGGSVEALGEGRAIIQLDDGSVLRLNANTSITFVSMDPENIIISNDGGELYSRVVKLDRTFQVASGDTIYESLGTAYLTINKDKEKGVEVFHSKVKVTDGKEEIVVDEGKMYFITHDDKALEKVLVDIPEDVIKDSGFIAWNKNEDIKTFSEELGVFSNIKEEEEEEEETVSADKEIILTHSKDGNISWTYNKVSAKGFKVVWSKNQNPTYPTRSGDKYKYISNSDTRSATINAFDGDGTYYVRVCEYLGGQCGVYSNQVQATLLGSTKEEEPASEVNSISLSVDGSTASWSVDGYSAKGFKVVWSKNQNPTYPTRSGDKYTYLSSPDASSQDLTPFDGDGTYYVRVCEYLGGQCGVYSNQVQVQL